MNEKELILTFAKEIVLAHVKAGEGKAEHSGDTFKAVVQKVKEAFDSIKQS